MKLYFCGFNGFQQIPNSVSKINKLTDIHMDGAGTDECNMSNVFLGWSYNILKINKHIYRYGFVKNKPNEKQSILIPGDVAIKQISCSENHVLLLLENGKIWKCDSDGNCKDVPNFICTEYDGETNKIVNIGCGKNLNCAISENGDVYNIPSRIFQLRNDKIIDVSCGLEHAMLLTDKGDVYTWGQGSRGQLGHGELGNEQVPRLVEALAGLKIISISAGGWHNAVVSCFGDIYVWGWNDKGQLGIRSNNQELARNRSDAQIDEAVNVMATPTLVPLQDGVDVLMASCGHAHTVIAASDQSLYGTGWNKYGQLSLDTENECVDSFQKLHLDFDLNMNKTTLKCGPWCTAVIIKT